MATDSYITTTSTPSPRPLPTAEATLLWSCLSYDHIPTLALPLPWPRPLHSHTPTTATPGHSPSLATVSPAPLLPHGHSYLDSLSHPPSLSAPAVCLYLASFCSLSPYPSYSWVAPAGLTKGPVSCQLMSTICQAAAAASRPSLIPGRASILFDEYFDNDEL